MIDTPVRASAAETEPSGASFRECDADRVAAPPWIGPLRTALAAPVEPPSLQWSRIVGMALAIALHLAALLHLMIPPTAQTPAPTAARGSAVATDTLRDGLEIEYVEQAATLDTDAVAPEAAVAPSSSGPMPQSMIPAARATATAPTPSALPPPSDAPAVATPAIVEPRDAEAPTADTEVSAPRARLFRSDGSIALPESVIENLRAVDSDDRVFSFMTPGLAGAESAFSRPPAMTYAPTRFDADWKPVRSLGEDALVTVSEALTYENKSKTVRCSLVPPVCTWGRIGTAVELNDPLTLNAIEDAHCGAMWESIVTATDQGEWLRLRRRFDAECRKPLELDLDPPAPRAVNTASD
jgi:hypothetical protein